MTATPQNLAERRNADRKAGIQRRIFEDWKRS